MHLNNFKLTIDFINHNFKIFNNNYFKSKNKILVEIFDYKPSTIPISYLSNTLSKIHKANMIAYYPAFFNFSQRLKYFNQKINPIGIHKIYQSFGAKKFLVPEKNIKNDYVQKSEKIFNKIKSKKDILNIKIDKILIGDLIYDEFLRTKKIVTIEARSKEFKNFLTEAVCLFFYWKNFIENEKIKAVLISHHVYFMGIVPRIAIAKNIPVYTVGLTETPKYLSYIHPIKHCGFENYLNIFKKFRPKIKKKLVEDAKKNLNDRFLGKKDIKLLMDRYTEKNIYDKNISKKKFLSGSKKFKVLIAAHQFNDAVHAHGNFLFSDFYEWIDFLGKCSEKSNFEWYIKFHPSEYKSNYKFIDYFKKKYLKFNILPMNITNTQLIYEKIDIVLTVYGSVGHEYPLFGIPVINASNKGPHKPFNFNIYPKNLKEYKKYVLNLDKVKPVKVNDIRLKLYIYYSMRYLMNYNMINKNKEIILKLGKKYTDLIYGVFLKQFSKKKHHKILKDFENFIKSKKFRMFVYNSKSKSDLIKFN